MVPYLTTYVLAELCNPWAFRTTIAIIITFAAVGVGRDGDFVGGGASIERYYGRHNRFVRMSRLAP